jgi:putative FmdB family regulatory protein
MATYQFKCQACSFLFEEDMPMSKASGAHYGACPECGELHPPRHYGEMNFVLKGDGWPSKNIRAGKTPTETKESKGLTAAKKLEDVMNARKKAGLDVRDKETGLSEKEVKKRKENIHRWIDEGKDK